MDEDGPPGADGRPPLYGLGVNHSSSSVFEDVEMAHDEVFSGPMAESLPTSVTAFAHHRPRADSMASFIYYDDTQDRELESPSPSDLDSRSDVENMRFLDMDGGLPEEVDDDMSEYDRRSSVDDYLIARRRSSLQSRGSIRGRLLRRDSLISTASSRGQGRTSQKVYMANEDLTIVIAGFKTSSFRSAVYTCLCIGTLGLVYLWFRWLPRLYIKLVGIPRPLRDCEWVVIENQWGELAVLQVTDLPYGRSLSTVFGPASRSYSFEEDPDPDLVRLRRVDYRYVRFCYHPLYDKFVLCNGWRDPAWTDVHALRSGLGSDDKGVRELVFGRNLIDIEQKSTFRLLIDEVLHPFYIFQAASLLLWSLDEYYYYAACIFIMSVGSITTTLLETRSIMRRLREISRFECDVRVLRSGFWRYISSCDLVPGDVYEVSDPNLTQFPSDSLLLSGDCIVNESMLTGESVPVSKIPAVDKTLKQLDLVASAMSPDVAKHFLFCGTKLIRARRPQEDRHGEAVALAMVVRTGFNTTKGSLVRSMLFPKPSGFKFYRDSFRYISVMAGVAFLGFIASFVNFIRLRLAWHLIIIRALDLITIIVPPALPATLTIGTNFALRRLKRKQIFCISPQRVNVGGKLDIMCFDKTGTLTEDGLDILGVRVVSRSRNSFGELLTTPLDMLGSHTMRGRTEDDAVLRAALHTMATCHSLRSVDNVLVGDPLDLKMFQFTEWEYEEGGQSTRDGEDDEHGSLSPSVARPPRSQRPSQRSNGSLRGPEPNIELGVLRSFEFVSQLRRASVIVRVFGSQSGDIYVKGAPECMREICRPETIPSDYDKLLAQYTHRGFRVIGCATRHIKKLSWVKAQKMKRHEAESHLDFVGFIIFENKLKRSTTGVIAELRSSNISNVMVTGDNILTAISVARECNLIDKSSHCFVPYFAQGASGDPNAQLKWESIDNSHLLLDSTTLKPLRPAGEDSASLHHESIDLRNYSIAVTGEIFRWIVDFAPPETLKRVLVCGRVFARMSPDEKHELVEKLQSIDYCCGFCGDGANDCGALKAADVGISLSEAEASVAAPFTSRIFDISCVPQVIREGRAALVTSFSCFKYMSLYSAIQFTSVSFLYASASNLGDFQFLFIDLLLILPIAVFMSWAGPFPILSKKRPTADLVSRKVLTPLLGQICICILIQTASWVSVRQQDWYIPPHVNPNKSNIKNSENTALFLVSCFEYILSGVVLNAGPPFRQGMRQNGPFVATIAIALIITFDMVLTPSHWLRKLMQLTKIPTDFKWYLVGLGASYIAIAWFCEHYVFPLVARFIGKARLAITMTRKKRKEYKNILDRVRGSEDV